MPAGIEFTPRAWIARAWKLMATVLLVPGGLIFFADYATTVEFVDLSIGEGAADRLDDLGRTIGGAAKGLVASPFWAAGLGCLVRGRRLTKVGARQLIQQDPRPPVVYLRSFRDEDIGTRPDAFGIAEEEQLGAVLGEIGPFVAIGKPGDTLPVLGAARLYLTADEWQDVVAEWMAQAGLVVLRIGETDGFWWEVERAVALVRLERLVFLVPRGEEAYERFRQRARPYFSSPLPEYRSGRVGKHSSIAGAVAFDRDGTPHFQELTQPSLWRQAPRKMLVPVFRLMLRPVFARLHVPWKPPSAQWGILATAGVLTLAFLALLYVVFREPRNPTAYEAAFAEMENRLAASPEFKAASAGRSPREVQNLARELAGRGLPHLDDKAILTRAAVIARLLGMSDPSTCAALARGNLRHRRLSDLLERLAAADPGPALAWLSIAEHAVAKGLGALPEPAEIPDWRLDDAWGHLFRRMPEPEARRLAGMLEGGLEGSNAEVCWAARRLYEELGNLDEPHGGTLARALVR